MREVEAEDASIGAGVRRILQFATLNAMEARARQVDVFGLGIGKKICQATASPSI